MTLNAKTEANQLRAKLDFIIHYLELLDLHYHALGADFTPPGWDMTVQEMVHRLKAPPSGRPLEVGPENRPDRPQNQRSFAVRGMMMAGIAGPR